jgi:DNA-binding CsgD family transcriptional regulator
LISGEPGIGKTRLVEESAALALDQGWIVLKGHAYGSDGMPPYLPFREALGEYTRGLSQDDLRKQLDSGTTDLALILPELPRLMPEFFSQMRSDPQPDRYRLFESVSEFLGAITRDDGSGLLLCIDDLHWADDATLLLLEHMTHHQWDTRLVILGTYRNTELDAAGPLARLLEQLSRQRMGLRLFLNPLDEADVAALLAALGGSTPPSSLVATLYAETEGNPFFVQEVFEHLAEAGRLFEASGRWVEALEIGETDVPQGVRLVVTRRLERLSESCRQVLSLSAVLGRVSSYRLLRAVLDLRENTLLDAIDEAQGAHLLLISPDGNMTFAHELIRQTVLSHLSAVRRANLHARVGYALEEISDGETSTRASELAWHFQRAGDDPATLARALRYSAQAANGALSALDYSRAIQLGEQALRLQEIVASEDLSLRCDLLLSLIRALAPYGENRRVLDEVAPEAYAIAESLGDQQRRGAIARATVDAATRIWGALAVASGVGFLWLQRADADTEPGAPERVFVDVRKSTRAQSLHLADERAATAATAYDLARELGNSEALYQAAGLGYLNNPPPPRYLPDMLRVMREMADEPREGVTMRTLTSYLMWVALAHLVVGDREAYERALRDLQEVPGRQHDAFAEGQLLICRIVDDILNGRLEDALARAAGASNIIPFHGLRIVALTGLVNMWLGHLAAVAPAFIQTPDFWSKQVRLVPFFEPAAAALLAAAGHTEDAALRLSQWRGTCPPLRDLATNEVSWALNAAVALRDRDLVSELVAVCGEMEPLSLAGYETHQAPGRLLGQAFALLGDQGRARQSYEAGLLGAEKVGSRPEIALGHLHLGEVLLRAYPGERRTAMNHLDFAIGEFEAMGMQPSLAQALRLRGRRPLLRASRRPAFPSGLTQREVDVLRLVAAGKTNPQIAHDLIISRNTVQVHVASILAKTGLANRAQAAAYAQRQDLT